MTFPIRIGMLYPPDSYRDRDELSGQPLVFCGAKIGFKLQIANIKSQKTNFKLDFGFYKRCIPFDLHFSSISPGHILD